MGRMASPRARRGVPFFEQGKRGGAAAPLRIPAATRDARERQEVQTAQERDQGMIRAEHLTMHYGPVVALNDVSFEVRQGEIVGLLGPNGAGKSTTMTILTTYLYPTSGTAQVGGHDVLEDPLAVRKATGYLPEILPL